MRKINLFVSISAIATMGFLYLPLMAVAFFSVNDTKYGLVWKGFTLDWYLKLFQNEFILHAAWNTLVLAIVSTLVSTILGTILAIGMDRFPWPGKMNTTLDLILHLPVIIPDIIFAAAMVVAFGFLRALSSAFEPGLVNMIIAHITFQTAFVALVVRSRLISIGKDVEEAARDLYADTTYLLLKITLPLLMPGIVAGAMLAFTLSLDDFVISFFTAGPDSVTLPLYIYAAVRRVVTPQIHALSTLILLVTIIMVILMERFTRKVNIK
ncbi:MAG: ABC transporter permease [Proteobacteria bacterium]|nr:ABC transporter permease [Pseudomonadota bacterium]MBU1582265.1 ABC transporter permease [Pseudomonadota bacterium]MBU2453271.1 ABC transporter permease [Pseudomonadota bacterium]MBU2632037.1 ABC transporter permease [Pseudomonadota bacterium]